MNRTIADALESFLARRGVRRLAIAGQKLPPPPMAYLVSFPRLSLVLSGCDVVEFERDQRVQTVRLRGGDALLLPGNSWNAPKWSSPAKVLTFLLGKYQTGVSLVHHRGGDEPAAASKMHFGTPADAASPLLEALLHFARTPVLNEPRHTAAVRCVESLLHCYLDLLRRPVAAADTPGNRLFQNICLYVQEHFKADVSRSTVASYFRCSPNHVSRIFHTYGLTNFNNYVSLVRIDRAKFLLKSYDLKLSEVARNCGFTDAAYFCRLFKQRTRRTPGEFRAAEERD